MSVSGGLGGMAHGRALPHVNQVPLDFGAQREIMVDKDKSQFRREHRAQSARARCTFAANCKGKTTFGNKQQQLERNTELGYKEYAQLLNAVWHVSRERRSENARRSRRQGDGYVAVS